jgi:putative hydrolase of the HAD superfamily
MRRYDAVVFDLFGTLIDILPQSVYDEAGAEVSAGLGVPADEFLRVWRDISPNRNSGQFGSVEGDIRHACGLLRVRPAPAQVARAAAIRLALQRRNQVPRPGAIETLLKLKSSGRKIALVSDAFVDVTRVWPESEFAGLMDAAVFSCDLGVTKPDPAMYNTACERIGVTPARCLYVGDGGSSELSGAKALGMTPVLIRVDYDHEFDVRRPDLVTWQGAVISSVVEVLELVR